MRCGVVKRTKFTLTIDASSEGNEYTAIDKWKRNKEFIRNKMHRNAREKAAALEGFDAAGYCNEMNDKRGESSSSCRCADNRQRHAHAEGDEQCSPA